MILKSILIKIFVLVTYLMLIPSCVNWNENRENTIIYQPDSLRLKAGTIVKTIDGIYESQCDELWISEKTYLELLRDYEKLLEEMR